MKVNGSLAFDASSASELKNLRVEKVTSLPGYTAGADHGRLVFLTGTSVLYYGSDSIGGGSWVATATGGNAFSQTEGDAIEASLGAGISTEGVFVPGAFPTTPALTAPTSFTNAINQIAAYATANDTLFELDDVSLSAAVPAGAKFLYTPGGGNWVDHTLVVADISNLTVTAAQINNVAATTSSTAELNKLTGATFLTADANLLTGLAAFGVTTAELEFIDGVTSNIQTQLNNKQALDATLTALAGLSGTGILVETGVDTFTHRSLVAPAAGITITDPAGVAGNPTFALANDLAAYEGLATTGYVVRTADGSAATRTFSTVPADIVITGDASGITTDTTFGLATVSQAATGDFVKVTLDTKGRVIGNTAVVAADITGLVSSIYVDVAGDTMTGNLVMGTNYVTMNNVPTLDTQAANKAYVDSVAAGLSWKQAVDAATTAALTVVYANGTAGVGATLTNAGTQAALVVDGVTMAVNNRVLVKDQAAPAQNGIYVVTDIGSGSTDWVLTRSTNIDQPGEFLGATVFIANGTVNDNSGWTQSEVVTTVGTDSNLWNQFSGANTYTWGDGLANSGNTIFVNMGAGVKILPSDEVGLDIESNKAIQLTGTGLLSGDQLTLVLAAGSGLEQAAAGLKISAAGVTNAMLVNSQFTLNGDTGTDSLILGDTLQIKGTTLQGISTATTESPAGTSTVTITAANASYTQRGVAFFETADFTVVDGFVSIASLSNGQLDNSTITFTGTTGSDAVALGESMAIIGDSGAITTAMGANSLAISARLATDVLTGVATFDAAHFTVTAGNVALTATLDDLTNVSTADSAATNSLLQKSATDWVAVTPAAVGATILLGDLQDVGTAPATTAGQALIADGSAWQAAKIYHLHSEGTPATTWTVNHSIGQKYCNVTIVDAGDEVVIPQSITFNSTTQLTVTFNTAVAGKAVVMGVA